MSLCVNQGGSKPLHVETAQCPAVVRMLHLLARGRKIDRVLYLSFYVCLSYDKFFVVFLCFMCTCYFVSLFSIVSASAIKYLERLVSEMIYCVSIGT